jgi:DNA uptake protein ComE-like DNA-binding protein
MRQRATTLAVVLLAALAATPPVAGQVGKNSGVLYANLATKEQLAAVPHLDAASVDALLKARPFLDALALDRALPQKLTPEQRKEVYARVFVPINLNAATRPEILLVPGVGARMAHEFEEYRPYDSLARFRREIGKYVDAAEVARLEQYVFVPVDLNTASEADILTIPGVGKRMLHEFLEYRPYKSLEQFRREIGKYVPKEEVARLERYVTIK